MDTARADLATFSCRGPDWRTGFDAALAAFRQDGVLLLQNVFTATKAKELQGEYDRRWNKVRQNLKRLEQEEPDEDGTVWLGDTQVRFFEEGRYEISWEGGVLDTPDPQAVRDIVKEFLKDEYIRYAGGLPSLKGSVDGEWHRDVYSLFGDERLELELPLFYLTMLIPLTDISLESGPTEFLLESHRLFEESCSRKALGLAKVGDAVIFNGMVRHRGTKNKSPDERKMLYIVHCKKWYNDY